MLEYLPEEVIVEILWRLPIKTILRCTSVCKSWYSLITNPNFISTHLHRPTFLKNNLMLFWSGEYNDRKYKLHFDDNCFREYMLLDPPFDCNNLGVAGTCNGIICMYTEKYSINSCRFILWNPSIRKYLLLPSPQFLPNSVVFVGFGFDSKSHNYKVLRMLKNFRTELYSLRDNSWKDITDITPKFTNPRHLSDSIFVNGALHWTGYRTNDKMKCVIMVFDLRDEAFHEIVLPQVVEDYWNLRVGAFGESSIAVFNRKCNEQTDIWVMKEYGVVASWMMLGTVGKPWRGRSRAFGFRSNGDVLLEFSRRHNIASQNVKSPNVKILLYIEGRYCDILSYEESLALLGKGNDGRTAATSSSSDAKRIKISN